MIGLGDLHAKLGTLPEEKRKEIEKDIDAAYASRPKLAMVNSDKGITNLHVIACIYRVAFDGKQELAWPLHGTCSHSPYGL